MIYFHIEFMEDFISDNTIDKLILERYNEYSELFIATIINELRRLEILTLHNSIYAWNNFIKDYVYDRIRNIINKKTYVAKQKLAFVRSFETYPINDYHIAELICENIDDSLIIH